MDILTADETEPITTRDRGDGYHDIIVMVDNAEHVAGVGVFVSPMAGWSLGRDVYSARVKQASPYRISSDVSHWTRRHGKYPTAFCVTCKTNDRVEFVPDEVGASHLPWDTISVPQDDEELAEMCEHCLEEAVLDPDRYWMGP